MGRSPFILLVIVLFHSFATQAQSHHQKTQGLPKTPDRPLAEDRKNLSKYFFPTFGKEIKLNDYNDVETIDILQHRGRIEVSPPSGECITIQRVLDKRDLRVCERKYVSFELEHIDAVGKINWLLKTATVTTPVSWPTSYRHGKVVYLDMPWPGPSVSIPLLECKTASIPTIGRRIYVRVSGKEQWTIAFPDVDSLTKQPPPRRNLIVEKIKEKTITVDSNGEASLSNIIVPKKSKEKYRWQLHPRDSYAMNGSNFMTTSSNPRNSSGECRYRYHHKNDKSTGILECHDVDHFKWIYLPLSCLPALKGL